MNNADTNAAATQKLLDRILVSVVDDDEAVRNALVTLLESAGFNVETFGSAEQFMESPSSNKRCCLLLDFQLPRMNGLDLQRRLSGSANDIPIIFISGHPEKRLREQALEAGAVGILDKPFSSEALLDAVYSALI
jgi:FixJ family two-component response regulator